MKHPLKRLLPALSLVMAEAVGLSLTFTRNAVVRGRAAAHADSGTKVLRSQRQPDIPPAVQEAIEKTRYKITPQEGTAGSSTSFTLFVMGMLFAAFVGVLFYLFGVIVSAQGQILKASLDGALNNSPFLTNDHRARIMSLR